jgi:hypothetical protein
MLMTPSKQVFDGRHRCNYLSRVAEHLRRLDPSMARGQNGVTAELHLDSLFASHSLALACVRHSACYGIQVAEGTG